MKYWGKDKKIRFGIMGAGNIAVQFCKAVSLIEEGEVRAVSSKTLARAEKLAERFSVPLAYDNYEEMLKSGEVDVVYIATTTNFHFELTMLCLDYRIPVLCEKAMFMSGKEAEIVFERSRDLGVFVMEGMWSRFLPKIEIIKGWLQDGKIGELVLGEISIGFSAPKDYTNRYFNAKLGGGAMYDLLVYCYDIMTYLVGKPILDVKVQAVWGESDVDVSETVLLQFEGCIAVLAASLEADLSNQATLYGTSGKIVMQFPHYGLDCLLYQTGKEPVSFIDKTTQNGFTYEIKEVIKCIKEGKIESDIAPHTMTLEAARLYDKIKALK